MADSKFAKRCELSRGDTEKFITYYISQECLWNLRHEFYSKRDHRQAALKMISSQMTLSGCEMTVEQVTTKIASLRTYYGRELRKINCSEKSGAAASDVYVSSWEYFSLLDPFLRSHVQQRNSTSNMMKEEPAERRLPRPVTDTEETELHNSSDGNIMEENQTDIVEQKMNLSSNSMSKKRKTSDSADMEQIVIKSLLALEEKNRCKVDKLNDADYLFGQQVGLEVKKIANPRKKQELKLKIQQLIFDFSFENEQ